MWHIENFNPVQLDEHHHGRFYTGDCYIVLHTYFNDKSNLDWQIWYWIGHESTVSVCVCVCVCVCVDSCTKAAFVCAIPLLAFSFCARMTRRRVWRCMLSTCGTCSKLTAGPS